MRYHLVLFAAAACSSASPPDRARPPAARTVQVPAAPAPTLDGTIDEAEWARARTFELGSGVKLRFMHDGAKLYVAVAGLASGTGFGCALVADGDHVAVFHASAKLGSAHYAPSGAGGSRPQSKEYVWRDAATMLREEGWTATTVEAPNPPAQEFAITFERLGLPDAPKPLAFGYLVMPPGAQSLDGAKVLAWPADLDDGAANLQLIAGFNPDDVRFATTRWMLLRP